MDLDLFKRRYRILKLDMQCAQYVEYGIVASNLKSKSNNEMMEFIAYLCNAIP